MKLCCEKCERKIQVAAKDIQQMGLNVEPWQLSEEWQNATHLVCPFCVVERGGRYWLAKIK